MAFRYIGAVRASFYSGALAADPVPPWEWRYEHRRHHVHRAWWPW
jgi:hypothetical protein